jgi:hypothetical protein
VLDLSDEDLRGLRLGDVRLLEAILTTATSRAAARKAKVAESTLYRALKRPAFRHALLAAQREYLTRTVGLMVDRFKARLSETG